MAFSGCCGMGKWSVRVPVQGVTTCDGVLKVLSDINRFAREQFQTLCW